MDGQLMMFYQDLNCLMSTLYLSHKSLNRRGLFNSTDAACARFVLDRADGERRRGHDGIYIVCIYLPAWVYILAPPLARPRPDL